MTLSRGKLFTQAEIQSFKKSLLVILKTQEESSTNVDLDVVVSHLEDCLRLIDLFHFFDLGNNRKLPLQKFLLQILLGSDPGHGNLPSSLKSIVTWNQPDMMQACVHKDK